MKTLQAVLVLTLLATSACTWVKPTEEAAKVVVAQAEHVRNCKKLSTTTFSVKHQIRSRDRKAEKVNLELLTLGKNEAAAKGGDTIVAHGPAEEGSMVFDIYRCINPE